MEGMNKDMNMEMDMGMKMEMDMDMDMMSMGSLNWSTSNVAFFLLGIKVQSNIGFLLACIFIFFMALVLQIIQLPSIRKTLTNEYEIKPEQSDLSFQKMQKSLQQIKIIKKPRSIVAETQQCCIQDLEQGQTDRPTIHEELSIEDQNIQEQQRKKVKEGDQVKFQIEKRLNIQKEMLRNKQEQEKRERERSVIFEYSYQYGIIKTLRILGYHSLIALLNIFVMLFTMSMNVYFILAVALGVGFGKTMICISNVQNKLRESVFESESKQKISEVCRQQGKSCIEKQSSISRKIEDPFVNPFQSHKENVEYINCCQL